MLDRVKSMNIGSDRAVSEIVGFIIVFSLVLSAVVLVYIGGLGGLETARDVEQLNNAERAFDVLANNFQKMARGQAPHRATEIKLSSSTLATGSAQNITFHDAGSGDSLASVNQSVSLGYHTSGGASIVYEHGAVIRVDSDGSATMQREPDYIISEDRTVVRYIQTRPLSGGQSMSGDMTVLVRSSVTTTEFLYEGNDPEHVQLVIRTTTERAPAWERYLSKEVPEGGSCEIQGTNENRVVCEFETDSLTITRTQIRMILT